ncbi:MAG: geranylgeranyl pyrophosphate synthase, partial [Betaproteobacteria bacterium]
MDATQRIEQALANALECWETNGIDPPRLAAAMRHAVFPGGARIRPRLCLAIAAASGDPDPDVTE